MNIPEISPCPFCGAILVPPYDKIRGVQHHHPENDCYLSGRWILIGELDKWNRRQPTPEAAEHVYVYACPFCNEYKDGPTSLREHLLTCDVFSDAACGAPLLFVIQRRGRIIPNHYMNRENADAAIYKRGGTVIPLYHHPAHPPKPEPTEAPLREQGINTERMMAIADNCDAEGMYTAATSIRRCVIQRDKLLASAAPKPPAEWMEAAAREIVGKYVSTLDTDDHAGFVTDIKQRIALHAPKVPEGRNEN